MAMFIIGMMTIALFSAIYGATMDYGNPAKIKEHTYIQETRLAISTLAISSNSFRSARGIEIRESQWQADIETVAPMPPLSYNGDIYFTRDGNSEYFCISAQNNNQSNNAFNNIIDRDVSGKYSRDNHCNIADEANKAIISYSL